MASQIVNRDVFYNDPTEYSLQNNGVSKVNMTSTLKYELATFVCEGEYERGLSRILETYLGHLHQNTQPSAWVSGFYGSGKSHLVKILEALWSNEKLEDGQRPRDIVELPDDIRQQFLELSAEGTRAGGLWTASGMLSESGDQTVRMLLLGIVFKAAGLSSNYGRAKFRLWMRDNGWEADAVRMMEEQGRDPDHEFEQYLVSPYIRKAVAELSGLSPDEARSLRSEWAAQFNRTDISVDEMESALKDVLRSQSADGESIPLTLIVLDEAQQYIGDSGTRAQALQEAVERIQSAFESKVLVVATGQAALNTTPNLQKLQGRFTVNVQLADNDVEKVVRKVVLRKNSQHLPDVRRVVNQVEGEIDRHLQGSRIAPKSDDKEILDKDYPLLPTRNRFWAALLHKVDPTGTSGQLRTQLRVVHNANVHVAERPLGHVIPADFIYEQLHPALQQSAVLPREVSNLINDQDDGSDDGKLRARLIQLIFLIEQLREGDLNDIGVLATPENLADLLVEDLTKGSEDLRRRIPELLGKLENDGRLLRALDGSYAIQTGESLKWQSEYQQARASLIANPGPLGDLRSQALQDLVREQTRTLRRTQGQAAEKRDISFVFGNDTPESTAGESNVVIWVRDEWNSSEKTVRADARDAGDESAIIYVFLPQRQVAEVQNAIATFAAAKSTLESRGGSLDSPEGQQAAESMRARMAENERKYKSILTDVVANGHVYQGGGAEVDGASLREKLQVAFDDSLTRQFPQFAVGDEAKWSTVFTRATQGSADPLKAIGHTGDDEQHPVIREVRKAVPGGTGTTWAAVRKTFRNAPYGWPQDTIDGAVAVLVGSGAVRAEKAGKTIAARELTKPQANQTTLVGEDEVVQKTSLIAARGVFQALNGRPATDDDVRSGAAGFVDEVLQLQRSAGGEPPLPMSAVPPYLQEMQNLAGNQLINAIASNAAPLRDDIATWRGRADEIAKRMETWRTVSQLAEHAAGLEGFERVRASLDAIRDDRQLLENPDPVAPVRRELGDLLRSALGEKFATYSDRLDEGVANLAQGEDWLRLAEHQREGILSGKRLRPVRQRSISSDRELLNALDDQSLQQWDDAILALSGKLQDAASEAARFLEPQVQEVVLEKPIMRKPIDVERWVNATKDALLEHVNNGRPVRIQ